MEAFTICGPNNEAIGIFDAFKRSDEENGANCELAREAPELKAENERFREELREARERVRLLRSQRDTVVNERDAWPSDANKRRGVNGQLLEALECLVHRCDAEGVGTAWAPLTDARAAIEKATVSVG